VKKISLIDYFYIMRSVQQLAANYGFITYTENDNETHARTKETNKKRPEPDKII
jgi:hypothetical protein